MQTMNAQQRYQAAMSLVQGSRGAMSGVATNIENAGTIKVPPGINVVWSPVNQGWIVKWHDSVLRVINTKQELKDYLEIELGGRE